MNRRVTFVLRVTVDEGGHAHAIVELVRSGRKEAVSDIAALGSVVAGMLGSGVGERDPAQPDDPSEAII